MSGRAWLIVGGLAVVGAIVVWRILRSQGDEAGARDAVTAAPTRPVPSTPPSPAELRQPPTRVARVPVAERLEMAKRIEAARAARAAAKETEPPKAGESAPGQMDTADQILEQLQGIAKEIGAALEECKRKYAPTVAGFKTQLKLVGDPDIGTLIDASTPVVDGNGAALAVAFDDCVRAEFQALALPPIKTGDRWDVTFSVDL